jgi:hypothetical protein
MTEKDNHDALFTSLAAGTAAVFASVGILVAGLLSMLQVYGPGTDPVILIAMAWVFSVVIWAPVGALAGLLVWLPIGAFLAARHGYLQARYQMEEERALFRARGLVHPADASYAQDGKA